MSLKDHPILIVIAACATVAASTWTVSEQIRVKPLEEKLAIQFEKNRSAPVISDIKLSKIADASGQIIEQNISYSDPEGDAGFINWIVLQSNKNGINVNSVSTTASTEEQKKGANQLGRWSCGSDTYYVKFRVIITDQAGHASEPSDYTVNCNI